MQPQSRIIYITDPMCSWCWAFSPEVHKLRHRYAGKVEFEIIAGVLRSGSAALSAQQSAGLGKYWQTVMDKTGQEFNVNFEPAAGFAYDTEPSCRALVSMRHQRPEQVFDYLAAIQAAFYLQHEDVTDAQVLAGIASSATGVDTQAFLTQMQSQAMRMQTQNDLARRLEFGIDGFPTLLYQTGENTRMLAHGYQDATQIASVLDAWLRK